VGVGSYLILSSLQNKAQKDQYEAITRKIESSTLSAIMDKQDALTTGSTLISQYCPTEADWPDCRVPFSFYQSILNPLHRITQTRSLSFSVKVDPSRAADFEDFAYQFYQAEGHPELGLSPFGRGIFSVNTTTGERFHDISGDSGDGKYKMLLPILEATDLTKNAAVMMFNTYSQHSRVDAIDYSFDCVQEQHKAPVDCTAITNIIFLIQDDGQHQRPASLTLLPISPKDSSSVVGIIAAVHNWDTVLNLASNEKVDGIMAVLSDGISAHSYIYDNGQVSYIAAADVHSSKYESQKVSFTATPFGGPTRYTVALYPTEQWMNHYLDDWPLIACLTMVGLVMFTSFVFYLYDYLMNREAVHKDLVMQTKRQYVRYISHEIRTPLNVVHLGFQVLYTEMKKAQTLLSSTGTFRPVRTNQSKNGDEAAAKILSDNTAQDSGSENSSTPIRVDTLSTSQGEISGGTRSIAPTTSASPVSTNRSNVSQEAMTSQVEDWVALVQDIVESANAAIAVLNDLIDYDKIDSGTMNLQLEPVPVKSFVESSVHPFIVQARAKEIDMEIHCAGNHNSPAFDAASLVVLADRVKFGQVLRNLVSNALKFTPSGGKVGVAAHFDIIQTDSDTLLSPPKPIPSSSKIKPLDTTPTSDELQPCGRLVLTVADSGAGMTQEQVKQLFREGVQFNPNDLQAGQGSGLGLWITKGIVDSHHGELIASSEGEGQGTTFTLTLPLYRMATQQRRPSKRFNGASLDMEMLRMEEGVPHHGSHAEAKNDDGNTKERDIVEYRDNGDEVKEIHPIDLLIESNECRRFHNVLVTDDSAVNRKMMCRSLASIGFKCFQAADGQECLNIINKSLQHEHENIDLVLMDYEMPRMNGPNATASIKQMRCNIPVIGVTGNILNEDKQLFLDHGAVFVLQKPFSLSELEEILKEI
jgi:signal transduction histidine kinase/ActR/RegA family two-component response regulator